VGKKKRGTVNPTYGNVKRGGKDDIRGDKRQNRERKRGEGKERVRDLGKNRINEKK